jgi:hypothetical protein
MSADMNLSHSGNLVTRYLLIGSLLIAAPAFAQWPNTPPAKTPPTPVAQTTPQTQPPLAPLSRQPAPQNTAPRGDDGTGFGFGVRAAYSTPLGGLTNTQDMHDVVHFQIPIWVELGYHITKSIYAGAYGQWAPNLFSWDVCLEGQSCSSNTERLGVEVRYGAAPDAAINPWVGLGFGYEWFHTTVTGNDRSFKGFEMLVPEIGVDYNVGKVSAGFFASYSLFGKYTSFTSGGVSNDLPDSRTHSWFQAGIRVGARL